MLLSRTQMKLCQVMAASGLETSHFGLNVFVSDGKYHLYGTMAWENTETNQTDRTTTSLYLGSLPVSMAKLDGFHGVEKELVARIAELSLKRGDMAESMLHGLSCIVRSIYAGTLQKK